MFKKITIFSFIVCLPVVSFAAFFENTKLFLQESGSIVDTLTLLVVALALLLFFWGLAQFITKSGDPSSHEEGKNKMVWGVITLFVMLSIWGILFFIGGELGLEGEYSVEIKDILPKRD